MRLWVVRLGLVVELLGLALGRQVELLHCHVGLDFEVVLLVGSRSFQGAGELFTTFFLLFGLRPFEGS